VFVSRLVLPGVALLLLIVALGAARPSSGAAPEARYTVVRGDTLWEIAERHYGGDIREAVWRIEQRNELADASLQPGQVLILP
jgi:nucleoid-associated protein YgaU